MVLTEHMHTKLNGRSVAEKEDGGVGGLCPKSWSAPHPPSEYNLGWEFQCWPGFERFGERGGDTSRERLLLRLSTLGHYGWTTEA